MQKIYLLLLLVFGLFASACFFQKDAPRVLVFSKTEGYRHACIPAGMNALRGICQQNSWKMDSTENAADFNETNLKRYAVVIFLNTTGDVLDPTQEADFERYIQAGGGFVGVHSATDTEYGWKWYGGLVGAYFNGHPAIQNARVQVHSHDHPATQMLPEKEWNREDEWYNFKEFNPTVNVLLSLDESSYQGGTMNGEHPLCWYHEYDGGRAFYTEMGHTEASYADPLYLQHLEGGVRYAIGGQKRLAYQNCRRERRPDPTRFVKTELANELTEPMEFDMLPDGKILLVERRGALKMFNPNTGLMNIVYKFPVHSEHEDGLMGMAIDPNWEQNHWVYFYYSPPGEKSVNRLSRFEFSGDTLNPASEKTMLEVGVQRKECCHTGGSVEFDAFGNLYLSTGDNTNPFESSGYAPIDERPGRSPWDAQKSSANSKDLRGKILRIHPNQDGTYACPADNLFASDTTQGRPEIYVMGCRNPFRISIDSRRNLLFWGEVGPDAGEPDSTQGPQGFDEINRARQAGFFGWPYLIGNNIPYSEYNFGTGKASPYYDPQHPQNNSPNNKGARALPPAQEAMIWYPYGNSEDFPLTGNGGRSAMAGPTYYCDQYAPATRLPDYYNGQLIAYEWMRGWMMAITLDSLGNFSHMEPMCDSIHLSRPMDMMVDKNGSIWVLEYGTQWFSKNEDARLSRIDYVRGNRPPKAILTVDKTAAAAPASVVFSLNKTRDYDNDRLDFRLDFGDGSPVFEVKNKRTGGAVRTKRKTATASHPQAIDSVFHRYEKPGVYTAMLTVADALGATATASCKLQIGNEPPSVYWDFGGKNRSFYEPGNTLAYKLAVKDREDGQIDAARVATNIDYLKTGFDITLIAQGHQSAQSVAEYAKGKTLMERSDCRTCHAIVQKVNGPSFQDVATRYKGNEFSVRDLSLKIIKGGAGNWGETVMSAHPQLSEEDAGEIVRWILSLGDAAKPKKALPMQGTYALTIPAPEKKGVKEQPGTFIFQASYRDGGSNAQAALEGSEVIALRPSFLQAEQADSLSRGVTTYWSAKDTMVLKDLKHGSFFMFRHVDLHAIYGFSVGIGTGDFRYKFNGGALELRQDAPDGPLLGSAAITVDNSPQRMRVSEVNIPFDAPVKDTGFHDLYFVVKNPGFASQPAMAVDWVRVNM